MVVFVRRLMMKIRLIHVRVQVDAAEKIVALVRHAIHSTVLMEVLVRQTH